MLECSVTVILRGPFFCAWCPAGIGHACNRLARLPMLAVAEMLPSSTLRPGLAGAVSRIAEREKC